MIDTDLKTSLKKAKYLLPSSTVLMLHLVSEGEPANSITLTRAHLEELLARFSCFASVGEVLEKPAAKRIALSFDDGYANLYETVYPILKARGVPFTAFITPGLLDTDGYLTAAQLSALARDPLVTVGSHGLTHLALKGQNAQTQTEELLGSKERLEAFTGRPVTLFAYPNGQADGTTFALLRQSKAYDYAFLAAGGGIGALQRQPYAMPRLRMDEKACAASMELLEFAYH